MARPKKQMKPVIEYFHRARSPKGAAAFAHLHEPDESFNKISYRINVFFDKKDPEFVTMLKEMKAFAKEHGVKNLPIKLLDEKLKEYVDMPIGTPYIAFESPFNPEKPRPISVFDAKGKKDEDLRVFGTDIVRVEFQYATWTLNADSGVKPYLSAVQLLKRVYESTGGGGGGTFGVEEDFIDDIEEDVDGSTFADDVEPEDLDIEDEVETDPEADDLEDLL